MAHLCFDLPVYSMVSRLAGGGAPRPLAASLGLPKFSSAQFFSTLA